MKLVNECFQHCIRFKQNSKLTNKNSEQEQVDQTSLKFEPSKLSYLNRTKSFILIYNFKA